MNAVNCVVSLLIADNNPAGLEPLSSALAQPGLEILTASGGHEGLDLYCRRRPPIVLAELTMPGMSGMELLRRIMEIDPAAHVILMTAHGSAQSAVEAIRTGAADYLNKPVPAGPLRERLGKMVAEARRRQHAPGRFDDESDNANPAFEGIVGRSPCMLEMFSRMRRLAPLYRSLLITGETGTGKDLAAGALHRLSPARSGRYVVLNCSAVVESLFESELFGHVRGAFTGATHDKPGLFECADGGTLFLDEIGDMPAATQAKLLRVLQNQEVQRVGALSARRVDVRVIAATNHDLPAAIAEKRFRQDLYYRLSMVEIKLPRLADRIEDLPRLERHFVARFAAQYGKEIRGLTHRAHFRLAQHTWPGNVRELENVLGYAAMMTNGDIVDVQDFPSYLRTAGPVTDRSAATVSSTGATLREQERLLLLNALEAAGGNQCEAARTLRIGRDALRYKLKRHNIRVPDVARAAAAAG